MFIPLGMYGLKPGMKVVREQVFSAPNLAFPLSAAYYSMSFLVA